ncbi:GNAT family N-acetyltransferase [Guggenheimella bovis]
MNKNEYLMNPTSASSLTYWKTCHFEVPSHMKVIHESGFDSSLLENYTDVVYFKLLHDLSNLPVPFESTRYTFMDAPTKDFVDHINSCYELEGVTLNELEAYKSRLVYDEDLWICLYDKEKNVIAASGIAEYDPEVREGSLDWIQVSKEYRGEGLGKVIVYELLRRLKKKALFVTVSGRVDNQTNPERLYESCGFKDKALWHILMEK